MYRNMRIHYDYIVFLLTSSFDVVDRKRTSKSQVSFFLLFCFLYLVNPFAVNITAGIYDLVAEKSSKET